MYKKGFLFNISSYNLIQWRELICMGKMVKYIQGSAIIFIILAPIMKLVEVIMALYQPTLMANIIDIGVGNGDIGYVLSTGYKMLFIAFIGVCGGIGCSIFASIAAMKIGENIRQGLFDKIQTLSFAELDKFKTSSLITRLTNDVTQVQNMFLMSMKIMVKAPLMCIGGMIMAFTISPKLSIIFFLVVPVIGVVVIYIVVKSIPLFSRVQLKMDRVNQVIRENLLGIRVVKAFVLEHKQKERFNEVNYDLMNESIKVQKTTVLLGPVVTLVINLSVVAVLWFGGNLVTLGNMKTGQIMAFINYLLQIMHSLMMAFRIIVNFSRAQASVERINEVFVIDPSVIECDNPNEMKNFDIEFKNVSFKYNDEGEDVLSNLSFKVYQGQRVGIIGATGSGKSSLVNLIPRFYDSSNGQVLIGGIDVKEISLKSLRENVGVVLQETILFSGSVKYNLKFGNEYASDELIDRVSQDSQTHEFISQMDNKYETHIEQRGKNLSGGQKQRISIGRTLIKESKILILDDATSALDISTELGLHRAIKNRMKESTVLIIGQKVSSVMDADKIIVIDNGRIVSEGTHDELIKTSEIYQSIAVSQLGEEVFSYVR